MTPALRISSYSRKVGLALEILTILVLAVGSSGSDEPQRRFEYQLSFKGPHLVQRDGSIPFWTHGGREYFHCFNIQFAYKNKNTCHLQHDLVHHEVDHAMAIAREVRPKPSFASTSSSSKNGSLFLLFPWRVQPGEVT